MNATTAKRRKFTVAVSGCSHDSKTWETVVVEQDKMTAIEKAVVKLFGKRAFFQQDNGLSSIGRYGQIFRSVPNTGSGWRANSVTGRIFVSVEPVATR